jgi:hypothetical protein
MDIKTILGLIAVVIGFIGYADYVRDIFRGNCKPHLFTWIIWLCVTSIALLGQLSDNAGAGAWTTIFGVIFCLFIVSLSFKYGSKTRYKSDYYCLIGVGFAMTLYFITHTLVWSVLLISMIDVMGFIPSIRKSLKNPHNENATLYQLCSIRDIFSIFALSHISFLTAFYPICLFIINGSFGLYLWWRQKNNPKN